MIYSFRGSLQWISYKEIAASIDQDLDKMPLLQDTLVIYWTKKIRKILKSGEETTKSERDAYSDYKSSEEGRRDLSERFNKIINVPRKPKKSPWTG